MAKSVIRWAGSKKKLIPVLKASAPPSFNRYIEPFCGSACFFIQEIDVNRAILSDTNPELICALNYLQFDPVALHESCVKIPKSTENYYRIRSLLPENLTEIDRATRFLYLNRYGFNGVYRTNSKGFYNVPMGKKTGSFASLDEFIGMSNSLAKAKIVNSDFMDACSDPDQDDFFYLDPPYSVRNVKSKGEYGMNSFSEKDEGRLIEYLEFINSRGANFLLSYKKSQDLMKKLDSICSYKTVEVFRHIASFTQHRQLAEELVFTNY